MPEEEQIACRYCGTPIAKRGLSSHERFCDKNPDKADKTPAEAGKVETAIEEAGLDEMNVLETILKESNIRARVPAIVRAYSRHSPDNLLELDNLLRIADVTVPARRMVLKNWAGHRGTEIPEELRSELEREESEEEKRKKGKGKDDTLDITSDLREERKSMVNDLRMQRESMMLQRQIDQLSGGLDKKKEPEKVEMPLLNPDTREPVFDAHGNPVFVPVDPEKEYKRMQAIAMYGGGAKKEDSMSSVLVAMITQQTAIMTKLLEGATKTDTSDSKLLREQMDNERKRYEDLLNTIRDENARMQREQTEERMRRIEMALAGREDDITKYLETNARLKEQGLLGSTDKEVEMLKTQREAMNQSFSLVHNQLSRTHETMKDLVGVAKDVYTKVAEENVKERIRKRTAGTQPREYTEEELKAMAAGLPPEAAEEAPPPEVPDFYVVGGTGRKPTPRPPSQ